MNFDVILLSNELRETCGWGTDTSSSISCGFWFSKHDSVNVHILKNTGCSEWKIKLCCKKDCVWEIFLLLVTKFSFSLNKCSYQHTQQNVLHFSDTSYRSSPQAAVLVSFAARAAEGWRGFSSFCKTNGKWSKLNCRHVEISVNNSHKHN